LCSIRLANAQQDVLTGNYDNGRTNANLNETILTPATVQPSQFGKLFALPVDGQIYAQPLYKQNVAVAANGTHNVIFVATQHNSVFAYDADTPGPPLWSQNLGPPVPSSAFDTADEPYTDVTPEIGILGAPVIDASSGTLYVVAMTMENGTVYHRLHALDIGSGAEKFGAPVAIAAQVTGIGDSSSNGIVPFVSSQHLQRPALLLANGTVYVAFGSHGDSAPWHGWLFGYSAANVQTPPVVYNATPNGSGGSFWQSGRGPAVDSQGNIFVVPSNGDSDQDSNFSDTVLKLSPGKLAVSDWFAPDDVQMLNDTDDDLGASGPMLIPGTNLLVTGGKQGTVYLLNTSSLGHFSQSNGQIPQSFQPTTLIFNMALWNRSGGPVLYLHGANDFFSAFQMTGGIFNTTPLAQSSGQYDVAFQGMAISANGGQPGSGILWATVADSWPLPSNGTLHAFNADGLTELWNSSMNPGDALGVFAKFANPTVANGKVYVPSMSNQLVVYGLAGSSSGTTVTITGVVNAASYANAPLAPGEVVAIFGQNLGPKNLTFGSFDNNGFLSTEIAGTQITFNGVPAPLLYTSAGQVAAVVPFEVASSTQVGVQANYNGQLSTTYNFTLASSAPGVFSMNASGSGGGAILNQDYSINSPSNPAAAGSVVMVYATGGGQTNPVNTTGLAAQAATSVTAQVTATVANQPAQILYAGNAPTEIEGVLQINVQLPAGVAGQGSVPLVLNIGGQKSQQTITVAVQ
jgi:uncharacterized protein (TIGR03437 family)